MTRCYPGLDADALRAHLAALRRFNEWEEKNPLRMEPAEAIAAVGFLYDLLPPESRERPVDVSGIRKMHRDLSVLRGDPA